MSPTQFRKKLSDAKILIVEDEEFNLRVISEVLFKEGYKNIIFAKDGLQAFEQLETEKPDLIILDLIMPNMDGYQFCQKARENKKNQDIPILVQTKLLNAEEKLKAYESGATDVIEKPIERVDFAARVRLHLEKKFLISDLKFYHHRLESDLQQATQMQTMLLPKADYIQQAEKRCNIHINSIFEPCAELGGDFWGIDILPNNNLAFYITDFSGHGVTAAINTFRIHTMIKDLMEEVSLEPADFLQYLNNKLCGILTTGQFATMFYGVIDRANNNIKFASAASTTPLLIKNKTSEIIKLEASGNLLGVSRDARYETKTASIENGDRIFVYSDALIETTNRKGEFFGEDRLIYTLSKASVAAKSHQALLNLVKAEFEVFKNGDLTDDLTINVYTIG